MREQVKNGALSFFLPIYLMLLFNFSSVKAPHKISHWSTYRHYSLLTFAAQLDLYPPVHQFPHDLISQQPAGAVDVLEKNLTG